MLPVSVEQCVCKEDPVILQKPDKLSPRVRGLIWILAASLMVALVGSFMKLLGRADTGPVLPLQQIGFARYAVALAVLTPILAFRGGKILTTNYPGRHAFRVLINLCALFSYFFALQHLPLANAVAISFTDAIFTMLLAIWLLGELVDWRRWIAAFTGLAGVLVMVEPTGGVIEAGAVAALLAAFFLGLEGVIIKLLVRTERPATMLFIVNSAGTLFTLALTLATWVWPSPEQWIYLGGIGLSALMAQTCFLKANQVEEANFLAPFTYFSLLFAAVLGLFLFNEVPELQDTIGAGLIVLGGVLMLDRRPARRTKVT